MLMGYKIGSRICERKPPQYIIVPSLYDVLLTIYDVVLMVFIPEPNHQPERTGSLKHRTKRRCQSPRILAQLRRCYVSWCYQRHPCCGSNLKSSEDIS